MDETPHPDGRRQEQAMRAPARWRPPLPEPSDSERDFWRRAVERERQRIAVQTG